MSFVASSEVFQLNCDIKASEDLARDLQPNKGDLVFTGYGTTYDRGMEGAVITRKALETAPADLKERPTILFNHDQDRPIGRVIKADVDDKGLLIVGAIDETEKDIQEKIRRGTLSKLSIRGRILKSREAWDDKAQQTVRVIDGLKMLEVSVVSVPAVAQAAITDWYIQRGFKLEEGGETMDEKDVKREEEKVDEPQAQEVKSDEDVEKEPDVSLDASEDVELLLDLEEKVSDLLEQMDEIRAAKSKLDQILDLVKKIYEAVSKGYPYPYPGKKRSEEEKPSEEAKESASEDRLDEVLNAIKDLSSRIETLEKEPIVRGTDTKTEEPEKDVVKDLIESEIYKKADPRERLHMLWKLAEEGQ